MTEHAALAGSLLRDSLSSLAPRTETRPSEPTRGPALSPGLAVGRARHGTYRLGLATAAHLPLSAAYWAAKALGRARHRLLRSTLRVNGDVVRALDATPSEVDGLARRASELRASEELEAFLLRRVNAAEVLRMIRLEGLGNLEAALADGKGAVLYSGHIRSTPVFFAGLARVGYPSTIVGFPPGASFPPSDRRLTSHQAKVLEERFGCRFVYMRAGDFGVAVKAANVLRENGVVVMLLDRPQRKAAVDVEWLDGRAPFSSGPAFVARETGAPLLDFYVHRDSGWLPQVAEIGPPHSAAGDLEPVVQECARRLEAKVLRHPAQWSFFSSYEHSDVVDATDLCVPA